MNTPVVFLIFNRPDLTLQTFEAIRRAKPKHLYVVSDGPRQNRPDDVSLCAASRAIVERVDWDCEVTREYSDVNLGCGKRVSSGITKAFEVFEEAIILEDDCLPHESFFAFCSEMLARYRDDQRVVHVAGHNAQPSARTPNSYYFSKYTSIWGWATWRRAWRNYDFELTRWREFLGGTYLKDIFPDPIARWYWSNVYHQMLMKKIDTWDYQWMFSCWLHNGLAVIPEVNLITNTGHRSDATHTVGELMVFQRQAEAIGDFIHPPSVTRSAVADDYFFEHVLGGAKMKEQQKYKLWFKIYAKRILNWARRPLIAAHLNGIRQA